MKTFKNTKFTKRNYECTNVVACVAESAPKPEHVEFDCGWVECDESILTGLTQLWIQGGVRYFGWL